MEVTLMGHMGSDLTVVNAARVSFNKESQKLSSKKVYTNLGPIEIPILEEKDSKLIKYLAQHGHWTTFSHCFLSFKIKAPIFVARQLGKHQVGLSWNEISRRYVNYEPEFYNTHEFRLKPEGGIKQGSSEVIHEGSFEFNKQVDEHNKKSLELYNNLIRENICPEIARMVLPQNMMTEWWWSGSLYAFIRVCNLRMDKSAQKETRYIANLIYNELKKLYPVTCSNFFKDINQDKDVSSE